MKKIIETISNNILIAWALSCLFVFFLTIWNTPLDETIIGSLFFGTLAIPIVAVVVASIDTLTHQ